MFLSDMSNPAPGSLNLNEAVYCKGLFLCPAYRKCEEVYRYCEICEELIIYAALAEDSYIRNDNMMNVTRYMQDKSYACLYCGKIYDSLPSIDIVADHIGDHFVIGCDRSPLSQSLR